MKVEDVKRFLVERLDADVDESTYRIGHDADVVALLRAKSELVRVNGVRRVAFEERTATLITDDSEYFVDADDIFGIELGTSRLRDDATRPGFGRH